MIKRDGYVSNSSSSSFVVIGKVIGHLFEDELVLDKDKHYIVQGKYLYEADDIINLDNNLVKWFKEHYYKNDRRGINDIDDSVIEVSWCGSDACGDTLPKNVSGLQIWSFDKDHHSTYSVRDAEINYPEKD